MNQKELNELRRRFRPERAETITTTVLRGLIR